MKDRITKKRVRVDYEAIIQLLSLSTEFRYYQLRKGSHISLRRQMYAFLRSYNVDIYSCSLALKNGITNVIDLVNWCGSYKAMLEFCYGV